MSDVAVDAWSALLRTYSALVPVLDRELQATTGLPLTWYDVMLELYHAPDRTLTMGELGRVAVVSRSRTSRVVDELVEAGLVERRANPSDRRSALAVLTAAGGQRFRRAAPHYLRSIERHFAAHLRGKEAEVLAGALRRVLAKAGSAG
jgi:DNA-binding MarR family transcriptional regulator